MRIGIFGGTFDPIHESHISMGLAALKLCCLDKVFFVPTRPWQKTAKASENDRAAMLALALAPYEGQLEIDRRELERGGPSYSVDTLYSFRKEYGPETPLVFIMGADQWKNFKTWILWEKFPLLANLLIFSRDGSLGEDPFADKFPVIRLTERKCISSPAGSILIAEEGPAPFSSTDIRNALRNKMTREQPIPGLAENVHDYIISRGLYLPEKEFLTLTRA